MDLGASMLLYDRLLHGVCLAHYCVPVGDQEELYTTMAESRKTPSVPSYVGYRKGLSYYNYMGEACCRYERSMLNATILRIFGPDWIYGPCQPIRCFFRFLLLHGISLEYWYVGY